MANLKNKILQTLKDGRNLETILNKLSKSQENLLKNYSNPVFNAKDKNKILNQYSNLQDIGKSLYRYNVLNKNGLDTKDEKSNLENGVLKSGISYNKYVWHSEKIEEAIADSERDQVANRLGRERGRKYPNCKCYELMQDLRPDYKK